MGTIPEESDRVTDGVGICGVDVGIAVGVARTAGLPPHAAPRTSRTSKLKRVEVDVDINEILGRQKSRTTIAKLSVAY